MEAYDKIRYFMMRYAMIRYDEGMLQTLLWTYLLLIPHTSEGQKQNSPDGENQLTVQNEVFPSRNIRVHRAISASKSQPCTTTLKPLFAKTGIKVLVASRKYGVIKAWHGIS